MKAKEDYQFYCCGDCLQEGNQLLLKHKVVCNDNEDLSLASNGLEQLEMMKQVGRTGSSYTEDRESFGVLECTRSHAYRKPVGGTRGLWV